MASAGPARVELRIGVGDFRLLRSVLEPSGGRERAAFLFVRPSMTADCVRLLVTGWWEVPDAALIGHDDRGLRWSADFNVQVLGEAISRRGGVVLIHSHGALGAYFSVTDSKVAASLMPPFSRLLASAVGSVVLGEKGAAARFWVGGEEFVQRFGIAMIGETIHTWPTVGLAEHSLERRRLARQNLAIGGTSDAALRAANVAIVGLCGGGSHVTQQLTHAGVGNLILIDDQPVEDVNRGRMVGSRHDDDGRPKVDVLERLVLAIDPSVVVVKVPARVPAPSSLEAIKHADVVVACVDSFVAREQINSFCRRHLIPLVDIGLTIESKNGQLASAKGQVVVVTPDSSCLRCSPLLSDAVLDAERAGRPPGYDSALDAQADPQVVSMNGVLASEAVNCVLHLLTGYAGTTRTGWWAYDGQVGSLVPCARPPRRLRCDACAEQGHGDPG